MNFREPNLSCFAETYAEARSFFRDACTRQGVAPSQHLHPLSGPHGEVLATDVAWVGDADARNVLVLLSGTHGIEGFCGSGCQADWLTNGGPSALPQNVGVLLIHAINPYGYSWLRRTTEENVDLNRNGIDFGGRLPANPGYDELRDALCPPPDETPPFPRSQRAIAAYISQHGAAQYRNARTAGQYRDPGGIHFGGTRPSWSRLTLEKIIRDFLAEREQVAVVDYHTGLGPFGYGEPICGSRPGEPGQARARRWYGDSLTEPMLGTSTSSVIPGLIQYVWAREVGLDRITFIALEYGTYSTEEVDSAMVEENWLYATGRARRDESETVRIQERFRRVYYPDTADWKEMVLARSRQIIRQTTMGLASLPTG